MPRREYNNPTEVIMRLLEEYETWIGAYDELLQLCEQYMPQELHYSIPPRPRSEQFHEQIGYRRGQGLIRTRKVRDAVRRLRSRGESGAHTVRYQSSNDQKIVDKVGEIIQTEEGKAALEQARKEERERNQSAPRQAVIMPTQEDIDEMNKVPPISLDDF